MTFDRFWKKLRLAVAGAFFGALLILPGGQAFANTAYVTNANSGTVSIIDTITETVVNVTVGSSPYGIAVTPDGAYAYVALLGANAVARINSVMQVTTLTGIPDPYGVAITPNGEFVYVTSQSSNQVYVINTNTFEITTSINVGTGTDLAGIAITPDGKFAYVANNLGSTVYVIDTQSLMVTDVITVGAAPSAVAVTPNGQYVFVTNQTGDSVSAINTSTKQVTTIGVGVSPLGVAVTPDGQFAYVTNNNSDSLSKINAQTLTFDSTITGFSHPLGIAFTPDGVSAYVVNEGGNNVSLVEGDVISTDISVQSFPFGVAISSLPVSFSPSSGNVSEPVSFDATPTGGTGPYTYVWNFGDGGTGAGNPASHTYTSVGTFYVQVTITDSLGNTGTATQPFTTSLPVSTPTGLQGKQKINNFGVVSELYNTLSWEPSSAVTGYNLHCNGVLIAILDGNASSYEDHNQSSQSQTYALVAVNGQFTSSPATVSVGK